MYFKNKYQLTNKNAYVTDMRKNEKNTTINILG